MQVSFTQEKYLRKRCELRLLPSFASITIRAGTAPSPEDISVTKRLNEAGKILGITLLDHIITGDDCFVSLKERGFLSG